MENYNQSSQQRDIVLSPNEFMFVQSNTNGIIKTYTGPITITISAQDSLVAFDTRSKKFIPTTNVNEAKQSFIIPPENWYAVLKNPAVNESYPEAGKANASPELNIGRKINIRGPVSFALFPGQMAKVIRGHALRSNQYLLARVYEAESANKTDGEVIDQEGNKVQVEHNYVNGQTLVIKGTEVSFYIPPTGIEVIPLESTSNGYVREAVTLERLEYCILKDEDGNKRYVHGPAVVFPKPTESFIPSPSGSLVFRAIELSKISGIYVKVIAAYDDKDSSGKVTKHHPIGEELFITGADQMIYYPRPEHAIISYDNKIMHHAIAIPEGEGRYVMNRLTGDIKTVHGPAMYLPDPRTEVVVLRKLTPSQCALWYPGNSDVLAYNTGLSEKAVEKNNKSISLDSLAYTTSYSMDCTLANLEAKANISRGTSYTKPRTITLDNKYEGVVSLDVWTGYAVNVISKDGTRKVVMGPQTVQLDYDQTLEVLELSTGKPKSTDNTLKTVYLRYENNKVSDLIDVETKDLVPVRVKVSYCVDFDTTASDKWFNVENYVKYLCDRERSLLKREAKKYNIEEFYQNYTDIVRTVAIKMDTDAEGKVTSGRYFEENGMLVKDCEVLGIEIMSRNVATLMETHQYEAVTDALKLTAATKELEIATQIAEVKRAQSALEAETTRILAENKDKMDNENLARQTAYQRKLEAEESAKMRAQLDLQEAYETLAKAKLAREKLAHDEELRMINEKADIEACKQAAYADTVAKIMESIGPDLVAALTSKSNSDMLETVTKSMSPVAMARGESVAEVTNLLLRGTSLEGVIDKVTTNK